MAKNELPSRENKRGGKGWWMDLDGVWRAPQEWPEDTPPLDGWVRDNHGQWHAPAPVDHEPEQRQAVAVSDVVSGEPAPRRSRQAEADRKAMFTVAGVVAAALLILAAALVLITQAGAEDIPEQEATSGGSVVFAAETDHMKMERRRAAADQAPERARAQLSGLEVRAPDDSDDSTDGYDPSVWTAERTDCLDVTEQVLVDRSAAPVQWADQLECVPDRGRWVDRYLDTTIRRTIDADVSLHVPAQIAYVSGGSRWSTATRQAYLTDIEHLPTLQVTSAGSGHNPRGHDPSSWKPSSESIWCAYAIDWISVKDRWELSVTGAEQAALSEMLDTCNNPTSAGPDLYTMPIDEIAVPTIERIGDASE